MRHADDDLLHALAAGALDELVHRGDEALAALEREALLADVLGVQVALEPFGGGQPLEDVDLVFAEKVGLERIDSSRCCHQRFSVGSVQCMYSAPIVPQ